MLLADTVKSGAVSRMIQASDMSSAMRMNIAANRPQPPRALLLCLRQLARRGSR